ncbi:hypothetical protein ACLKM7_01435 [Microbacterium sp. I2]
MFTSAAAVIRSFAASLGRLLHRPRRRRSTWRATLADARRAEVHHSSMA